MKQIIWILVVIVLVIIGVGLYNSGAQRRIANSGDVFTHDAAHERVVVGDSFTNTPAQTVPTQTASSQTVQEQPATASAPMNQTGMVAAPVSDTIRRNPTNGMVFSGSGRFQLYRQGDITWRVNTDSGQSCILFATDEQWRLTRVLRHGCGNS